MSQRFLEYWSRGLTGTPAEVRARAAMRFERWRVTGVDETKSPKPENNWCSVLGLNGEHQKRRGRA
jgi:hypothetical protein